MKRRVVVTGVGVVSPIGNDVKTFWENLKNGVSGIEKIPYFDTTEFPSKIAGVVKDFHPEEKIDRKLLRRMDKFVQFAVYASYEALEMAGLLNGDFAPERAGVVIGSGIGSTKELQENARILFDKGPNRISPFFIPKMIADMASGVAAMIYNFRGPNYAGVSACASAAHSIGAAMRHIQYGDADIMLTGGAEAPITELAVGGFCVMKALSTRNDEPQKASRPFDANRDGFVIAEGAGILVLEELEHAKKRGAKILAELVGYGASADAYHMTAPCPDGSGAAIALKRAIEDAGISPEQIDYINAHGTSTKLNDAMETKAIKTVLGEHAYKVAVSSSKSMFGHTLGAAGGIEAVAIILAILNQTAPPTINYEEKDPECDLDYVPNKAREMKIEYAASNSFGFGGHNAVLIFKRWE